jgi:REP element-mobilizing transposase RayT
MFFLRPSAQTNQIVTYCLAVAAHVANVEVHAVCVMSNHWHLVVTDCEGRLPEFLRWAHQLIAKCINASLGRWENMWSAEDTNVVELVDDATVLEKIAYVIANPTAAGLVNAPTKWPGLLTTRLGQRLSAKRPDVFFRKDGEMPEEVEVRCTRPDIFRGLSAREVDLKLAELVARQVREARDALRRAGRTFLGARGVLKQAISQTAYTDEVRRTLRPRVAGKGKPYRAALQRLKTFWEAYRIALSDWRRGNRASVFPVGSYEMPRLHGAVCLLPRGVT